MCLLLSIISIRVQAQQPVNYNLYSMNPYLLNPAATTIGCLNAFINRHNQWTNLNNAPAASTFGLATPIKANMNLGGMVISDNRYFVNYLTSNLRYSYRINLNQHQQLTMGISVGIVNNSLNTGNLQLKDPNDPSVSNFNSTKFDAGAGAQYTLKKITIGAFLPHIMLPDGSFSQQYNVSASWDYKLKTSDWKLIPLVLARNYKNAGLMYDLELKGVLKEKLMCRLSYRTDQSVIAGIGFWWKNLQLAYAYQYHTGSTYHAFSANGTQEIQLSIRICKAGKQETAEETKDKNTGEVNEQTTKKKAAEEKAALDLAKQEKLAKDKAAAEKAAAEKAVQEKAAAENLAQEKADLEKSNTSKVAAEKLALEKAASEKLARDKAEAKVKINW